MCAPRVTITRASGEDVDLVVTGEGGMEGAIWAPSPTDKSARVMSAIFAIETGVRVWLAWEGEAEHLTILPLEGRGTLDFSKFGGLSNPRAEGWTGAIRLRSEGGGTFTIALELSKQRN